MTTKNAEWTGSIGNACAGLAPDTIEELRTIAALHADARGLIINLASWAGEQADSLMKGVPEEWQARVSEATELALKESYRLAFASHASERPDGSLVNRILSWTKGERWHTVAAAVTGTLGGLGGIPTALADLPVTITLILRSIQEIAAAYGEDLAAPSVRAQCVGVFGLGGPLVDDDAADTGLFAARIGLSSAVIAEIIKAVLPRLGIAVSSKLLAQATPVLGAAAGATINASFTSYYQTMAHVHFRLRKLERANDPDQIHACFERIARARRDQSRLGRKTQTLPA